LIGTLEKLAELQAFRLLRNHARNHNLRLADTAQALIDGTTTLRA
jgi:AmiR/NasT family two-component response regulator